MFTGIVAESAKVCSAKLVKGVQTLVLQTSAEFIKDVQTGASVSVNGVCLTVVKADFSNSLLTFDVIAETLQITNLSDLDTEDFVNVERSLKFGDEVGGHILSGHVQTTARVVDVVTDQDNLEVLIKVPQKYIKYITLKGYIAVDGVSLTVNQLENSQLKVCLIPETIKRTILKDVQVGQVVNIELDQNTVTIVDATERLQQ